MRVITIDNVVYVGFAYPTETSYIGAIFNTQESKMSEALGSIEAGLRECLAADSSESNLMGDVISEGANVVLANCKSALEAVTDLRRDFREAEVEAKAVWWNGGKPLPTKDRED
jgi:hypothetical protein